MLLGLSLGLCFLHVFPWFVVVLACFSHVSHAFFRRKWSEWEAYQDAMLASGELSGAAITVPGLRFVNGSAVELRLKGLIELPQIFQRAQYSQLFTEPPSWGQEYVGFLACPIGFVLVQYVIFIANKVRGNLEPELLKDYWAPGPGYLQ